MNAYGPDNHNEQESMIPMKASSPRAILLRLAAISLPALMLGACASTATPGESAGATPPPASPDLPAAQVDQAAALKKLFADADEAELKLNPVSAIYRGDMRYADKLGDYYSDAFDVASKKLVEDNLAGLAKIDRGALNPTDQLAYDVFKFTNEDRLVDYRPEYMALTQGRPMNHFYGLHTMYPTFSSGQGGAPYKTVTDYENGLKRNKEFVSMMDRAIARFKQGQAAGVVETKMTTNNMIGQIDAQLKQKLMESPYSGPIRNFPKEFSQADKDRFTAAYSASIQNEIYPVLTRLRDYLKNDYLKSARDGVGLKYMKGGDMLYQRLIDNTLTIHMTPDEVHNLGLSEVARIHKGMEEVKTEVGFKGTLAQFFDHLRTDPKLKMKSRDALTQGYYKIGAAVDAKVPDYFSTIPKSKLEIRPYEEFREKYEAGGSYESGSPDGSRPGRFYFNAYDLPSRTTPGMTTLYLHEGAPGHHFQISLAQENEALPPFMRFGGNTAYVEGWALYAETLGYPMGFYADPYQRMGTLSDEMLRAMRLVVDSGIHAKGWTREQAIDYMLANSDMGKTDATAEVERYIAIPSQALAYKVGALTIQRLRQKAESELGPKFDIKEFHEQVLMTGSLPLKILEEKIDRWIAAKKGA